MRTSPDEDAFRRFAVQVSPGLIRSAVLLTGDRHLAEDLVQDTLAKMYRTGFARRAGGSSMHIDNPAAYAHTVLTRQFLSHRRRRSSTERPAADLPEQASTATSTSSSDLRVALVAALARLSKRDRAVLVLRYLCDRSVEQVASDLGRSPSAVKVQSMRALARLRDVLGTDLLDLAQP